MGCIRLAVDGGGQLNGINPGERGVEDEAGGIFFFFVRAQCVTRGLLVGDCNYGC
jgi:hypothetical protein